MKITTYRQAVKYLESFIRPSIFKSITPEEAEILNPLLRMQKLLEFLGNPHRKFKSVQVTGTSGKGSTSYLISKILAFAGYKTGLTISPHIQKASERIQINNKQISDVEFIRIINRFPGIVKKMKGEGFEEPTYYEMLLSIAFVYFAQQKVDIAVVEVGIEGKYDATNLIDAPVVVLTNIGLDHTEILGDTVEKIAQEAVFAIRKNSIVITGEEKKEVLKIINDRCKDTGSKLLRIDKDFSVSIKNSSGNGINFDFKFGNKVFKDVSLRLAGDYQAKNAALAITAVLTLEKPGLKISEKNIRDALGSAFFPGRFEIISVISPQLSVVGNKSDGSRLISLRADRQETGKLESENGKQKTDNRKSQKLILDGAHNVDKMNAFLTSLNKYFPDEKKIFLIAFKKDKNVNEMVAMMQKYAEKIIFSRFSAATDMNKSASFKISNYKKQIPNKSKIINSPASTSEAGRANPKIYFEKDSKKALDKSLDLAQEIPSSIVVVTGSLYFVGEIRTMLFDNRWIYRRS